MMIVIGCSPSINKIGKVESTLEYTEFLCALFEALCSECSYLLQIHFVNMIIYLLN
jgi:hypothetical protein